MDEQNNDQMQQPFQGTEQVQNQDPYQGQQMNQYPNQYQNQYTDQYPYMQNQQQNQGMYQGQQMNQYPNQYPKQYSGQYPYVQNRQQNEKIDEMNVISLIAGIVAIITICIYTVSIPCSILGILFGAKGIKNNRRGKGMGIAGLVLSIIAIALWGILFMIGFSISSALG